MVVKNSGVHVVASHCQQQQFERNISGDDMEEIPIYKDKPDVRLDTCHL